MSTAAMLIKITADVGSATSSINALKTSLGSMASASIPASIGAGFRGSIDAMAASVTKLEANFKSFNTVTAAALPASLAMAAGGAAITAGLGAAVKSAADFQTTMTNVRNNTGMTAADQNTLGQAVLKMGAASGAGFDQLAEGGKRAMNVTGNMATSLEILDVAQKSAVSTNANVATTTNTLANAMHEYGQDVGSVAQVHQNAAVMMGMMHSAAQMSNMDLQQFADNSGRAIGIAANLGVPLQEVIAGYVGLTKHGFDAAGAQVQMVDIMTHMITPTKQTTAELERLGRVSGVDLVADFDAQTLSTKGLVGVMADITQAYKATGLSQAAAEGETMKLLHALRGGLGLGTLLGTGADDYAKALVVLSDKTAMATLTEEAYARKQLELHNHLDVLQRRTELAGQAIGNVLLPPLTALVGIASDVVSAFAAIPSGFQTALTVVLAAAGGFLSLAGAIGVGLWTAGPFVMGIKTMGIVLGALTGTSTVAAAEVATLAVAETATGGAAVVAGGQLAMFSVAEVGAGDAAVGAAGKVSLLSKSMGLLGGAFSAILATGVGTFAVIAAGIVVATKPIFDAIDAFHQLKDAINALPAGTKLNPVQQGIKNFINSIPDTRTQTKPPPGANPREWDALPGASMLPHETTAQTVARNTLQADAAKKAAEKKAKDDAIAANNAAESPLHKFTEEADQRKNAFEQSQVDNETTLLQLKMDQAAADQGTLEFRRQIEDLDRNSVDYAQKRLQLNEQDVITRAKMAEEPLKNRADDLTYAQQLLKAEVAAARARHEHLDMHAYRQQLKDLKTQEIEGAPALLAAQHNVTLADRAKSATDQVASLKNTDLERQKLALQEAMRPFENAAISAKRAVEDQQHVVDLAKQTFTLTEQQYALQKLILEAAAKKTALDLWTIEHPVPMSAPVPAYDPKRAYDVMPGASTVTVSGVVINVNGGNTNDETAQSIKDKVGEWFKAAVDQLPQKPVSPRLGGTYAY